MLNHYDIDSLDEVIPLETSSAGPTAELFNEAYRLQRAGNFAAARKVYLEALSNGNLEAGVNLLYMRPTMLFNHTLFYLNIREYPDYQEIVDVTKKLRAAYHPIVPYYAALNYFYRCMDETGYDHMFNLAYAQNKYACSLLRAMAKIDHGAQPGFYPDCIWNEQAPEPVYFNTRSPYPYNV